MICMSPGHREPARSTNDSPQNAQKRSGHRIPIDCPGAVGIARGPAPRPAGLPPPSGFRRPHSKRPQTAFALPGGPSVPEHWLDDRLLPWLGSGPRVPAGVLREGRPQQHAVADVCGGQEEGCLGAELLELRLRRAGEGIDWPGTKDVREGRRQPCAQTKQLRMLQALQDRMPLRRLMHLLRRGMPEAGGVRVQGRRLSLRPKLSHAFTGGEAAWRGGPEGGGRRGVRLGNRCSPRGRR